MSSNRFKQSGKVGLFDEETRSRQLSKLGDPLDKLRKVIDFEIFREELESNMLNHDKKSNSGCKPYDVVMMFKIMLIKRIYDLSDERAEFEIINRLSFQKFLGLSSGDKVPDSRTIWLFQNNLVNKNLVELLFERFNEYLASLGMVAINEQRVVDATIVEVPRQWNRGEENAKIKSGEGKELWKEEPEKKRQKDIDARWTVKRGKTYFGYKDHVKIDGWSKLIKTYEVTSASVHDSQVVEKLLREEDRGKELYGDSAYIGDSIEVMLTKKGIKPKIIKRGVRGQSLTEEQKAWNLGTAKTRCRIEHVFGYIVNSMRGFNIRSIGYQRVKGVIGLINLVYNLCRYEQIVRLNLIGVK